MLPFEFGGIIHEHGCNQSYFLFPPGKYYKQKRKLLLTQYNPDNYAVSNDGREEHRTKQKSP